MPFVTDEIIEFRDSLTKDQRDMFDRIWYDRREEAYQAGLADAFHKFSAYCRMIPSVGILKSAAIRWFNDIAPDCGLGQRCFLRKRHRQGLFNHTL